MVIKTKWDLNLKGGVVIANPIPEAYAMDQDYIHQTIETALIKAKELGIKGKGTTPFLLSEIKERTEGKSLASNIQLIYNNARVGAEVAIEIAKLG